MALSFSSSLSSTNLGTISVQFKNPRTSLPPARHVFLGLASSAPKARFVARRKESVSVKPLQRPLVEYMSLPASQYSVLDAERIERIDDNTFRCYVYRFKFFAFEVCPVLLVRVEEQPNGCCIKLLSCKLEGSPIVVAQNDKFDDCRLCLLHRKRGHMKMISVYDVERYCYDFSIVSESHYLNSCGCPDSSLIPHDCVLGNSKDCRGGGPCFVHKIIGIVPKWSALTLIWYGHAASMVNRISCDSKGSNSFIQQLTSDTVIEVSIEIPFAFRAIPVQAIESTGTQVLDQILKIMLPRFMAQLVKDYQAWASGDASRQPLGTGEI